MKKVHDNENVDPPAQLFIMTNSMFGPWGDKLRATAPADVVIGETRAIDMWVMLTRLFVDHHQKRDFITRRMVTGYVENKNKTTNEAILKLCLQCGLLETYIPPHDTDKRKKYTRLSKKGLKLLHSQAKTWTVDFGRLQSDLDEYYEVER